MQDIFTRDGNGVGPLTVGKKIHFLTFTNGTKQMLWALRSDQRQILGIAQTCFKLQQVLVWTSWNSSRAPLSRQDIKKVKEEECHRAGLFYSPNINLYYGYIWPHKKFLHYWKQNVRILNPSSSDFCEWERWNISQVFPLWICYSFFFPRCVWVSKRPRKV